MTRHLAIPGLAAALCALAAPAGMAEEAREQPVVLDEILVTGGREAVRKLPGSATYIDAEQIAEFDDTDITDLLQRSPGIYVRHEDGYGLRPNLGIRGAAAERSQKITIMEDGIPIAPAPYSAPAAYYLPNITRMNAVEVIKGPSSIRYGPHTVGGAINLVTAPVPRSREGLLEASVGNDRYRKYRATFGETFGRAGVAVDLLRFGADGFKELDGGGDTGFTRNDANLRFDWRSGDTAGLPQQLQLKVGWADEVSDETYLGLTDGDFSVNPDRRYRASALDRFDSEHAQLHLLHSVDLNDRLSLFTSAYVNRFERAWNKFDGIIGGPPVSVVLERPEIFTTEIALLRGEIDSAAAGGALLDVTDNDRSYGSQGIEFSASYERQAGRWLHSLAAGLRYHHDYVERDHLPRAYEMVGGELVFDGVARPRKDLSEGRTDALAFYLADEISLERWTLTTGIRVENIQREFDDYLDDSFASNDETVVLPGLGLHWQWTDELGLIAGIYRGFSPAAPAAGGSADSEESTNVEYGFRYAADGLDLELIGFFSDYSNLIGRCRVSDAVCEPGEEFGAGEVEIAGAEFAGSYVYETAGSWSLPVSLVYTWTESAFQDSFLSEFPQWGSVSRGDELPYLPEHSARLQFGIENDWLSFSAAIKHVSEMREVAGSGEAAPDERTPAYTLVDLSASWRPADAWEFFAVIENVADEREIVARRPIGARPTAPRMLRVGAQYRF